MTRRFVVCALALTALASACGDDDPSVAAATTTTAPACGPDEPQQIDPGSGQHLLPGTPEPTFNTNPPTSGPHRPGAHPTGVLTDAMAPSVQAALLEGGEVLIQYRAVAPGEREQLEALAVPGSHVTVAPNPSLLTPIVATAWLYSMECQRFDEDALRNFVTMHAGKNDGH